MFDLASKRLILSNLPKGIVQPRRAQVYVGFQCHQHCGFCYYKSRCNEKMFQFEKIKQQIDFEHEYGIREFEITGGEPSEHNQLRMICQYIKDTYNGKIAVITNGSLFSSDVWDIIDEVLVSYHLSKSDISYSKSIFPYGSTYSKVKKTIDKANENKVLVRTNTVLGTFNLASLDMILDDLIELRPKIVNFLPVNIFNEQKEMSKFIDYSLLRCKLKHAIDRLKASQIDEVNVRYMPFCCMEGYEQYIVGTLQHIYDAHDWNVELAGLQLLDMSEKSKNSLLLLGKYGSTSIEAALDIRRHTYQKTSRCLACKYNILCDGVERTSDDSLLKFIEPSQGKLEKDILHYARQQLGLSRDI